MMLLHTGKTLWQIDFFFLALLALLLSQNSPAGGIAVILPVLIHESAHLCALSLCKGQPKRIRLSCFGIGVEGGREQLGAKKEAFVLAAGPAANLICFLLLGVLFSMRAPDGLSVWATPHLILGGWNLLPVSVSDGGRLFFLLGSRFFSPLALRRMAFVLSFCILIALLTLAFFALFSGGLPLTLLLCIAYLTAALLRT